jgi:hypothetical protein
MPDYRYPALTVYGDHKPSLAHHITALKAGRVEELTLVMEPMEMEVRCQVHYCQVRRVHAVPLPAVLYRNQ